MTQEFFCGQPLKSLAFCEARVSMPVDASLALLRRAARALVVWVELCVGDPKTTAGETAMSQNTNDLKTEFKKSLALLQTLRDEVRVQIHLAGLDAKDRWNKLEPRMEAAAEKAAGEITEASRAVVDEAVGALKEFHASLKKKL
jgi:hypothetical protein